MKLLEAEKAAKMVRSAQSKDLEFKLWIELSPSGFNVVLVVSGSRWVWSSYSAIVSYVQGLQGVL